MSKKKILESKRNAYLHIDETTIDGEIGSVYEAMDEFTKSFVRWFYDEGWQPYASSEEFINQQEGNAVVTIERLFELYEKENA